MERLWATVDRTVEITVALVFAVMTAIGLLQVFNRFVLNASLSWSEEAQVFGHIWIVFLGIPIAYRRGAHMYVETFRDRFPPRFARAFDLFVELIWLAFAVSLVVLGYRVAQVASLQESPGLEIPMSWPYGAMVVGGLYLLLIAARRIANWFGAPGARGAA